MACAGITARGGIQSVEHCSVLI